MRCTHSCHVFSHDWNRFTSIILIHTTRCNFLRRILFFFFTPPSKRPYRHRLPFFFFFFYYFCSFALIFSSLFFFVIFSFVFILRLVFFFLFFILIRSNLRRKNDFLFCFCFCFHVGQRYNREYFVSLSNSSTTIAQCIYGYAYTIFAFVRMETRFEISQLYVISRLIILSCTGRD